MTDSPDTDDDDNLDDDEADGPPGPEPSELVSGELLGFEENGLAADEAREWMYRVAPSEGKQGHATLAVPLRVRASYRLDGVKFARSFIEPEAAAEIRLLVSLLERVPNGPVTIFGHADPVGSEDDNKVLSGRRARSLFALLTRDVDAWDELHQTAVHGDRWGLESLEAMLTHLGYDAGPPSGRFTERTKAAVGSFQQDEGLDADGQVRPPTRKALIARYMNSLCANEKGEPYVVATTRFLGLGRDPDGKAAYQGCGELNLRRRPSGSQAKAHEKDKALRNAFHAENRRVTVVVFEPGTTIAPAAWPCPRAKDGSSDCKKRLWSDAKDREAAGAEERSFWINRDTFQCRFYHRLHLRTVAEGVGPPKAVDFHLRDHFGRPAVSIDVALRVGGISRVVRSDGDGQVRTVMPDGAVDIGAVDGSVLRDVGESADYVHDTLGGLPRSASIGGYGYGRDDVDETSDLAARLADMDTITSVEDEALG